MAFLHTDKSSKFKWDLKGPRLAKTILKNNRNSGGLILPDFKTQYIQSYSNQKQCVIIETHTETNRTEAGTKPSSVMDPQDLPQGCQDHSVGKDRSTNGYQEDWTSKCRRNEARPFPYSIHTKPKWIKDPLSFLV